MKSPYAYNQEDFINALGKCPETNYIYRELIYAPLPTKRLAISENFPRYKFLIYSFNGRWLIEHDGDKFENRR